MAINKRFRSCPSCDDRGYSVEVCIDHEKGIAEVKCHECRAGTFRMRIRPHSKPDSVYDAWKAYLGQKKERQLEREKELKGKSKRK